MRVYQRVKDGVVMGWAWHSWGILMVIELSVSWLYQRRYPGCDVTLEFCKMLPLGETGGKEHEVSWYYCLQLHMNL